MRTNLDHLPQRQQLELARVRTTLLDEFEAALKSGAGGTSEWRRGGKVLKIILFGSYARDDWVDEPENGYLSDFDLLVIVSHEKLTDIADYWWTADDKIFRDTSIGRTVNLIVHTLAEVNEGLGRGEYFWTDIQRDGVVLYDLPGYPLAQAIPLKARDAYEAAQRYLKDTIGATDRALRTIELQKAEGLAEVGWRRDVAFTIHQTVERAYACFLLVHTFYFPRSHNIKFLRSLAEDLDKSLVAAWPREQRADRRRFELLKRAYVEARYSDQYDVTAEDLSHLEASARHLRDLTLAACQIRLARLADGTS